MALFCSTTSEAHNSLSEKKRKRVILTTQLQQTNIKSHFLPVPPLCYSFCPSQWAAPSPAGASGQGGIRDGVRWVASERHRDGVARSPHHLLHAVEVLRARGEERHSSCVRKKRQEKDYPLRPLICLLSETDVRAALSCLHFIQSWSQDVLIPAYHAAMFRNTLKVTQPTLWSHFSPINLLQRRALYLCSCAIKHILSAVPPVVMLITTSYIISQLWRCCLAPFNFRNARVAYEQSLSELCFISLLSHL